jgi:hypothetical protein
MNETTDTKTSPEAPTSSESAFARGADWKFAVMGALSSSKARRIYTAGEFQEFVRAFRPGVTAPTARSASELLVSAGALRRVSSGVFLNRRAVPPTELTEVAAHIRGGAIISMHSVLGECGFLNNPSDIVMAVLPTSTTKRPRLGEVTTSTGDVFRFFGLAEKFFPATDTDRFRMLQQGRPCEMFRPEAALLHWLHLAGMQRSSMTMPPADVDRSALDEELLADLAYRWDLRRALGDWRSHIERVGYGDEREPGQAEHVQRTHASIEASSNASATARERMMARRKVAPDATHGAPDHGAFEPAAAAPSSAEHADDSGSDWGASMPETPQRPRGG